MAGVSTFTEAVGDVICERIASGESVRAICSDEQMPAMSTVFKWLADNDKFSEQYARAKEMQADAFFEVIGEIAHDGAKDWVMTKTGPVLDSEHVQRSRLRVDTLKWQASKLAPKKYGDKPIEVGGIGGAPIQHSIALRFLDSPSETNDL